MQRAVFDAERFWAIEAAAGLFANGLFIEEIGDFAVVANAGGGGAFGRIQARDFGPVVFSVGTQLGR